MPPVEEGFEKIALNPIIIDSDEMIPLRNDVNINLHADSDASIAGKAKI